MSHMIRLYRLACLIADGHLLKYNHKDVRVPLENQREVLLTMMSPLHWYRQWWASSWLVPPP